MDTKNDNTTGLPTGFLIRDSKGGFKKVQDDDVVDFQLPDEKPGPATPPPAPPQAQPGDGAPPPPASVAAPRPAPPHKPPPPLKPSEPVSESRTAPLYLEPEDEEEIKQHSQQLDALGETGHLDAKVLLNTAIEKVARLSNVPFENEALLKRFTKAIESGIRGVRSSIETKELLMKQEKVGGLALSESQADHVVGLIEKEAVTLDQEGVLDKAAPQPAPSKPKQMKKIGPDLAGEKGMYSAPPPAFVPKPDERKKEAEKPPEKKPDPKIDIRQPTPSALQQKEEEQPSDQKIPPSSIKIEAEQRAVPPGRAQTEEEAPSVAPEPAPESKPPSVPPRMPTPTDADLPRRAPVSPLSGNRPHVVDIRQPMHVVGPIEELKEIDLKEFHRMGGNAEESAEKIFEKIELLEEESWQKRFEGVTAWRQSPLYDLYVSIGRESIDSKLPVRDVIAKRSQEQKSTLTMEEFLSINQLNGMVTI